VVLPVVPEGPAGPRASLEGLAARLEAASIADPGNALVARELRMTLALLLAPAESGFDFG
jgi:hypothetical protein